MARWKPHGRLAIEEASMRKLIAVIAGCFLVSAAGQPRAIKNDMAHLQASWPMQSGENAQQRVAVPAAPAVGDGFEDLKRLYDYDPKQALDLKEDLLHERQGVKVYDITYASPKGGRVTAYLVVPTAKGPHAGVMFGHWGPGNRTEFLPEATLYARAGAVSLLIDYPWVRPAPWRKMLKQVEDPESDHAAFVQAVVDLRRGIDLLTARADVDPKRLAYVGHSFGAQWGAILSAVDRRCQGTILVGGIPDQAAIWRDNDDPAVVELRASTPKDRIDAYLKVCDRTAAVRYVAHSASPLLFQFARYERYFNKAAMDRYAKAAREPKEVRWYDTGHELNDVECLVDRAAWLRDKIGLGPVAVVLKKGEGKGK
jgi:dienelactone hydrolase